MAKAAGTGQNGIQTLLEHTQHSSQPPLFTQSTQLPAPSHWSMKPLQNAAAGLLPMPQTPLLQTAVWHWVNA